MVLFPSAINHVVACDAAIFSFALQYRLFSCLIWRQARCSSADRFSLCKQEMIRLQKRQWTTEPAFTWRSRSHETKRFLQARCDINVSSMHMLNCISEMQSNQNSPLRLYHVGLNPSHISNVPRFSVVSVRCRRLHSGGCSGSAQALKDVWRFTSACRLLNPSIRV